MADLTSFAATAETGTPDQIFAALESLVQTEVGAVIFSCSTFDLRSGQSRRIYTNLPLIYPVSGLKEIIPNIWTKQVLDGGKSFVANTIEQIRQVFPDHEIIEKLGCGAVVNMPVFLAGQFLGTVNVLHRTQYYQPPLVQKLHDLRLAAMLAFASLALADRS